MDQPVQKKVVGLFDENKSLEHVLEIRGLRYLNASLVDLYNKAKKVPNAIFHQGLGRHMDSLGDLIEKYTTTYADFEDFNGLVVDPSLMMALLGEEFQMGSYKQPFVVVNMRTEKALNSIRRRKGVFEGAYMEEGTEAASLRDEFELTQIMTRGSEFYGGRTYVHEQPIAKSHKGVKHYYFKEGIPEGTVMNISPDEQDRIIRKTLSNVIDYLREVRLEVCGVLESIYTDDCFYHEEKGDVSLHDIVEAGALPLYVALRKFAEWTKGRLEYFSDGGRGNSVKVSKTKSIPTSEYARLLENNAPKEELGLPYDLVHKCLFDGN